MSKRNRCDTTALVTVCCGRIKMALFDRIKAAVKGNAVLKEYEVGQQIASAGPGLLWRVCRGVKRTTRKVKGVTACTCYCKLPPPSREPRGAGS